MPRRKLRRQRIAQGKPLGELALTDIRLRMKAGDRRNPNHGRYSGNNIPKRK